jgi:hypothetical protein
MGARDIWTDVLSEKQLHMLFQSGEDDRDGNGFGVELRGGAWATARSLERQGLGWIEGEGGKGVPALFFNNAEGVRILHEFDPDESDAPDDVVWLRDLDGTGSMHVCTPHCPGAIPYYREGLTP